jgi:hypothetical protein
MTAIRRIRSDCWARAARKRGNCNRAAKQAEKFAPLHVPTQLKSAGHRNGEGLRLEGVGVGLLHVSMRPTNVAYGA